MKKNQIKTLERLQLSVLNRRSVFVPNSNAWQKPRPAAFVINLAGSVILRLFACGMYEYEPKRGTSWGRSKSAPATR